MTVETKELFSKDIRFLGLGTHLFIKY